MPTFRAFVLDLIRKKLTERRCVVVYDPIGHYHPLAQELTTGPTPAAVLVEALPGPTAALLLAWRYWADLSLTDGPDKPGLIVYVAASAPTTPEAQLLDPFWALALGGAAFGVADSEQFEQLVYRCYPDHRTAVARVLAEAGVTPPSFALLDAVAQGTDAQWPCLRHALPGVEGRRELLLALLVPAKADTDAQLEATPGAMAEARALVDLSLGASVTDVEAGSVPRLRQSLWQLVLLGEFVSDLRCPLPAALAAVPRATPDATDLVYALAEQLRKRYPEAYQEQAGALATRIGLAPHFTTYDDLGDRLTFGFEDATLLRQVLQATLAQDLEAARTKLALRADSVWRDQRGAGWLVAETGLALLEAVAETNAHLQAEPPRDLSSLLHAYEQRYHRLDQRHRGFEAALLRHEQASENLPGAPAGAVPELPLLRQHVRAAWAAIAEQLQARLVTYVAQQGWPAAGFGSARNVAADWVLPAVQAGRRVALLLVDALRYELAQELRIALEEQGATVAVEAVCAQLPTITPVGMSALLPHDGTWTLASDATGRVVPVVGRESDATPVAGAAARDAFWARRLGTQVQIFTQTEWLADHPTTVPPLVKLLVVRSSEIDAGGEHAGLSGIEQWPAALRKLRRTALLACEAGFTEIVIATDHGFLLRPALDDGALVPVPPGEYALQKPRVLLGRADETSATLRLDAGNVSIPGPWFHYVVPRALGGGFERGRSYAHEGLSLPETVLPVLRVQFGPSRLAVAMPQLILSYGKTVVTTQLFLLTATAQVVAPVGKASQLDAFGPEAPALEIRLRVLSASGNAVGQVGTHRAVLDPGTAADRAALVSIPAGETLKLPILLDEQVNGKRFEGAFAVVALHPDTSVELFRLPLQTDFMG